MSDDSGGAGESGGGLVWKYAETDEGAAETLSAALGLHPLVARLLVNRGVQAVEDARAFLDPRLDALHDPHCLPDVDKAVGRLERAIADGETIFVHGDYDADGVTSAALCLRALSALGAKVVGFVPRRADGYDLQKYGVDKARERGASLILTADCGSQAHDAIVHANDLGIDVIVTDHHRLGEKLPPALAIVNPYRSDCEPPPFQSLAGAGVAFKVMDALVARLLPAHRANFRQGFVDLVALGTVADVTPLVGENRILVTHGLLSLTSPRRKGIAALLNCCDHLGKTVDAGTIGWKLGPRLNAAGRMEDADLAYRLLISRDADEAEQLAVQLEALAERSRAEIARVTEEALTEAFSDENLTRRVLVLARDRWGKGVIGVAAGRVAEQMRRPVFLLSLGPDGVYTGSARTHGDFPVLKALQDARLLLERFGGHSASAGLSVRAENLTAFRERLEAFATEHFPDEPEPPTLLIDARVGDGTALTHRLMDEIGRLAPFGEKNPEPVFATEGALVLQSRRVGKDANTLQLQLRFPGTSAAIKGVMFRGGSYADRVAQGDNVDVAYTPKINEWNGRSSVELMLKDVRLSG